MKAAVLVAVLGGCAPEPGPRPAMPAAVPVASAPPEALAATVPPDTAPVVTIPPPTPKSKAEAWVLTRWDDNRLSPFACITTEDGKRTIHSQANCENLDGDSLAAFGPDGKALALTRADKGVSCWKDGRIATYQLPAFAAPKAPVIAFSPQAHVVTPIGKKWSPTKKDRRLMIEAALWSGDSAEGVKAQIDPIAILDLDGDPELERLAVVTVLGLVAVSHGDSFVTKSARLVLDDGLGTFRAITNAESSALALRAVTDVDGDGLKELWIQHHSGGRAWTVFEPDRVADEHDAWFFEDCDVP